MGAWDRVKMDSRGEGDLLAEPRHSGPAGGQQHYGRRKLADSLWFDEPVLSSIEGLTMSGLPIPRVLSPSKDPQSVFSELPSMLVATSATAAEN